MNECGNLVEIIYQQLLSLPAKLKKNLIYRQISDLKPDVNKANDTEMR